MKKLVIMPGGFHPFHQGHLSLYNAAKKQFPDADVYVAATNDTSKRPFPFEIKAKLAQLAGVDPGHFIQVKSPFRPEEITKAYNPDDTELIYVRSEKDANESPRPGGTKKDGSPAYLQPFQNQAIQPMSKHAYIAYLPTVEFAGGITSATEIRNRWPDLSEQQKVQLVNTLYPKTKQNSRLAANVIKLLNLAIQGNNQGINEDKICPVCGCTPCNCTHIVNESIDNTDYVQQITAEFIRKVQPMRSRIRDRKTIIGLLDRFFDKFAIPEEYFDDVYHMAARRLESEQAVDEELNEVGANPKIGPKVVAYQQSKLNKPANVEFVSQGYKIKFTPSELQIFKGGDLVYKKEGDFANPSNLQLNTAKSTVEKLAQGWDPNKTSNAKDELEKVKAQQEVWKKQIKKTWPSARFVRPRSNSTILLAQIGNNVMAKWSPDQETNEAKKQSTQSKFEKHLAKHGYDVAEKSKYWDQKVKDIDAQIAAWDAEMQRRKRENLPESIKRAIMEGGHSLEDFDYVAEKK